MWRSYLIDFIISIMIIDFEMTLHFKTFQLKCLQNTRDRLEIILPFKLHRNFFTISLHSVLEKIYLNIRIRRRRCLRLRNPESKLSKHGRPHDIQTYKPSYIYFDLYQNLPLPFILDFLILMF